MLGLNYLQNFYDVLHQLGVRAFHCVILLQNLLLDMQDQILGFHLVLEIARIDQTLQHVLADFLAQLVVERVFGHVLGLVLSFRNRLGSQDLSVALGAFPLWVYVCDVGVFILRLCRRIRFLGFGLRL